MHRILVEKRILNWLKDYWETKRKHRDANVLVNYRISHESTYDVKSSMNWKKIMREMIFDTDNFTNSKIIEKVNFFNSENSFILDFEATTYVCNNKFLFDEIKSTSVKISWDQVSKLQASRIENVLVVFKDTKIKAKLTNCLYVSKFDTNLISINLLLQKDFQILFENNTCKITSSHRNLVSKTQKRYELYSFRVFSEEKRLFFTKKKGEKV